MAGAHEARVTATGDVYAALRQHLKGSPCRTFLADMKRRVEAVDAFFYPDVFVTCSAADPLIKREPVLVVKVLSPSTAARVRAACLTTGSTLGMRPRLQPVNGRRPADSTAMPIEKPNFAYLSPAQTRPGACVGPGSALLGAFENPIFSTRLVDGKVVCVSPDRNVDRQSGLPCHTALIGAAPAALAPQSELKLQAGLPAEVYIKGEQRTPLPYLAEPVTRVMRRAGRKR